MSHNYTERDGMFTVREPAWHGLQTAVFENYPTRQEAQQIAHPWEPVTEPLYRQVIYFAHTPFCTTPEMAPQVCDCGGEPSTRMEEVDGFQMAVRSDDSAVLGVITDTYEPVKNSEMYDIAEAIEAGDPTSVMYETGGSLKGGAKVWLLLRLREPLFLKGDNGGTIPYYALQNAHDGSGAFRGQATMTRIVCDNTSIMADMDARARGTEFVFRHTKNIKSRIEEAQQALAGWRNSLEVWRALNEHLIELPINDQQKDLFIEQFIPTPPPGLYSDRVARNIEESRDQWKIILQSPTCEGIENTAYGLVQASVEYAQHARRARSLESRFKRAYLDRSTITEDALRLAQMVAAE